jgi:hypothetical protein
MRGLSVATTMKRLFASAALIAALTGRVFAGGNHQTHPASHMPMVIDRGGFISQYLAKMRGLPACPPSVPAGYYMTAITGTFDNATCYQPIFEAWPKIQRSGQSPPLWIRVPEMPIR